MFRRRRLRGLPPSGNGASSFHLHWRMETRDPLTEVSATIEVEEPPAVSRLYFWALQVGFSGGGAAHVGLQWLPVGNGIPAVNWGGYAAGGGELDGSVSPLPSLDGNPNTRLFDWVAHRPYQLTVRRSPERGWRASIDDTVIRDLWAPGDGLVSPIVWSEVFAACDDPSVVVRWSRMRAVTASGATVAPDGVLVTYQSYVDGGCDNTTVEVDTDRSVRQITAATRAVLHGSVLPLPPP
jgi:hypothetical protein